MSNFIVTGPGRSGSTMLRSALQQHSEIHCLGEIFLPKHFRETYIPDGRHAVRAILDGLSYPLDKRIFGFSVLYNELFQRQITRDLVDELMKKKFKVIHVVRENLLRRCLSHEIARNTRVWGDPDGNKPSTLKIRLRWRKLRSDIERTSRRAEEARKLLGVLPFLELSYEDLCTDFAGGIWRVCEFLGAPYEDLNPQTFKQEKRSLREAIVNYRQLKLLFTLSKYRRFFDE